MKYPAFLEKNDTIGFAAPSMGCSRDPYYSAFQNALKIWERMGYPALLGPNCYAEQGIGISNTPEKCGEELTQMYLSGDCKALISCGGGEMMCEILDYVDFEAIGAAAPKWYMGYSDNTNFTFLLTTICDTASVYGPCASTFGMEPWHSSLQDAMDVLTGEKLTVCNYDLWEIEKLKSSESPLEPYHVTEPMQMKLYAPDGSDTAEMTGRLIGGCMDCLVNLLGTKFDQVKQFNERYAEDGIIWYLEACDLNVFGIRRAIWQMMHAGWFQHVKGFLIGRPMHYAEDLFGLDQYHAVTDLLKEYGVPILMDLDIGHLPPMMPLVNGSLAAVYAQGNQLRIDMKLM